MNKTKIINPLENLVFIIQKEKLGGDVYNYIPMVGKKRKFRLFLDDSYQKIIKIMNRYYLSDIQLDEIIPLDTAKSWIEGYKNQLSEQRIQSIEIIEV